MRMEHLTQNSAIVDVSEYIHQVEYDTPMSDFNKTYFLGHEYNACVIYVRVCGLRNPTTWGVVVLVQGPKTLARCISHAGNVSRAC